MKKKDNSSITGQLTLRRMEIRKLLIKGYDTKDIVLYANMKAKEDDYWDVDKRTIERDILHEKAKIKERSNIDKEYELGMSIARLDSLAKQARIDNDIKLAYSIEKKKIELLSLDKITKEDESNKKIIVNIRRKEQNKD